MTTIPGHGRASRGRSTDEPLGSERRCHRSDHRQRERDGAAAGGPCTRRRALHVRAGIVSLRTSVHFSSLSTNWATPRHLYEALDREFSFSLDPCPLGDEGGLFGRSDGLLISWKGQRVFCNPPYGPTIPDWLRQGEDAEIAVYLLPARTDVVWFHTHCLTRAREIRFIRGRLRFGDGRSPAPFPSMVVVYGHAESDR